MKWLWDTVLHYTLLVLYLSNPCQYNNTPSYYICPQYSSFSTIIPIKCLYLYVLRSKNLINIKSVGQLTGIRMMSKVGVSEPSDFGGSGSGYPRFWGLRLREGGFILSTGSSIIHIASIHNTVRLTFLV